jgi:SGNH domain (fused to AT3 domains)
MAAIPVYLVAILLFGWGAARLFAESSHFSLSTVSAHRADWYETPETTLKENEQCRIQNTYDPFEGGSVRVRTDCDLPAANSKLIVVGDSHAIAFGSLLKNYAFITGIPVTTYAGGGGFIQIYPSQEGCVKFCEAVINAIKQTANTGDVIFLPSLRVPRFRYPWDERDLDTEAGWRFLARDVDTGLSEAVSALQRMSVPGLHFVFELPTPIFKIPLFRCSDWFNRTNPACDSGTEISRQLLEQYRQPVVTFASALQKRVEGFSSWDPFPILCPGDPCSMLMNGKPLFFDADHVSGYANAVLLNDSWQK